MTKIIKNSIITVLFTLIVLTVFPTTVFAKEYEARLTAPQGEPYYTSELNAYSQTGYGMPNCVAYAYGRVYELNGEAPKISRGNAGEWWYINKYNDYYDYGQEPKLGAVACWSNHVAVVEAIAEDGSVTVSESHWGGTYFDVKQFSDMSYHYGQAFYGYIYTYEPKIDKEDYVINETYLENKACFSAITMAQTDTEIMHPDNSLLMMK